MTAGKKTYCSRGGLPIIILCLAALLDIGVFYTLPLRFLYPVTHSEGTESVTTAAVLFNGFNSDFTGINNETKRRVRHGASMLEQHNVKQLIVVGGNRKASKRKGAHLMADYLLELGVPKEKIIIEDNSRDSMSNLEQLGRILAEHNISALGLISSPYHLLRLQTMPIPFEADLRLYPYNPAECLPPLTRGEVWSSAHYNAVAYAVQFVLPAESYRMFVLWVREHTEW